MWNGSQGNGENTAGIQCRWQDTPSYQVLSTLYCLLQWQEGYCWAASQGEAFSVRHLCLPFSRSIMVFILTCCVGMLCEEACDRKSAIHLVAMCLICMVFWMAGREVPFLYHLKGLRQLFTLCVCNLFMFLSVGFWENGVLKEPCCKFKWSYHV